MSLSPNIQAIARATVVGRKVFDVIERQPKIRDYAKSMKKFSLTDAIYFNDVTFKYPTGLKNAKNVLSNANFFIKAGESTAIVGPSGSGKSTIV